MNNNKKSTKRALLTSVLSLVLCMSMLIGATFAWFTDSVTSGKNRIQAGNLDVEMLYKNTGMKEWEGIEVPTSPDFFKDINGEQILWEPGAVAYANFKVENKGSLALKYSLETIVAGCNYTSAGKSLADVLTVKVIKDEVTYETREDAVTAAQGSTDTLESFAHVNANMEKDTTDYFTVVLYWEPSSNDNDFNVNPALWIDIELSLVATQAVNEEDSFDNKYDEDALVCDVLATPETIQKDINNAGEGTVIGLAAGTYGDLIIQNANGGAKNDLTLVSNSAIVESINLNGSTNIAIDGLTFDKTGAETVWSYDKGTTTASSVVASITDATKERSYYGAQNIIIRNCTFIESATGVSTVAEQDYVCVGTTRYRSSQSNKNYTIDNCVFACNAQNYLALNYVTGNTVVSNNVFGGVYGTSHHNINATGNTANWTIKNNSFNNWADGEYAFGSSRQGDGFITMTITDNSFVKTVSKDESIPVLSIKKSYTTANSKVTVNDNTFNNGTANVSWNASEYKYFMTAESTFTVVANADALSDAAKTGDYVSFASDLEAPLSNSAIYGTSVAVVQKGGVIDGNTHSLDIENPKYDAYAIETYGGTIKNLTIDSTVGRGIVISSPKEDVYIDNVVIDGPGYAINTTEHNGKKLNVTNSTIKGWTSLAGLDSATFIKCTFGENTSKYWQGMGYDQDYDRLVRPYVTTTFTDCEFEKGYYIDLSALGTACTVTITNCTVNGVVLTEANYSQYISIELPSGRTLNDCVSFK